MKPLENVTTHLDAVARQGSPRRPDVPATPAEALQNILDVCATVVDYGGIETGTPEATKLLRAYQFLANHHGVANQIGKPRPRVSYLRDMQRDTGRA